METKDMFNNPIKIGDNVACACSGGEIEVLPVTGIFNSGKNITVLNTSGYTKEKKSRFVINITLFRKQAPELFF